MNPYLIFLALISFVSCNCVHVQKCEHAHMAMCPSYMASHCPQSCSPCSQYSRCHSNQEQEQQHKRSRKCVKQEITSFPEGGSLCQQVVAERRRTTCTTCSYQVDVICSPVMNRHRCPGLRWCPPSMDTWASPQPTPLGGGTVVTPFNAQTGGLSVRRGTQLGSSLTHPITLT